MRLITPSFFDMLCLTVSSYKVVLTFKQVFVEFILRLSLVLKSLSSNQY